MDVIKRHGLIFTLVLLHAAILTAEAPNKGTPAITPSLATTSPKNPVPTPPSPTTITPNSTGESFSLMLSDDEQKMISNAMGNNKSSTEDALICHYLGGIVYSV